MTILRPDTEAAYADGALAYEMAMNDWKAASDRVLGVRWALTEIRTALDEIEADVIVAGGYGDHMIGGEFGKNETQRKAQLIVALTHQPEYQELAREKRTTEASQWAAEADMQHAEHRMRGARLRLEWSQAWVAHMAKGGVAQ